MPINPFFAICNQKVAGSIPAAGTKNQRVTSVLDLLTWGQTSHVAAV